MCIFGDFPAIIGENQRGNYTVRILEGNWNFINQKRVLVAEKLDRVLNSSSASVILACLIFPFFMHNSFFQDWSKRCTLCLHNFLF